MFYVPVGDTNREFSAKFLIHKNNGRGK